MADRLIRDELWQSVRWLDLPSDSHRLVYLSLLMVADDYGNLEGGPRRLFRWMVTFTQIKTEADSIKLMSDLQDADLVRRYEVIHREYWHLPRFRNKRQYWSRKCPQSPYEEEKIPKNQKHRQKTQRRLNEGSTKPQRGVGVGVGVGEKQTPPSANADAGVLVESTPKVQGNVNPVVQQGPGFVAFWNAYPNKAARLQAEKAWRRLNPDAELVGTLMDAVARHSATDKWQRGYIPNADTWIRGRRWEDEVAVTASTLGQCMWNANGTREEGAGQCEAAGVEMRGGLAYCRGHAQRINP